VYKRQEQDGLAEQMKQLKGYGDGLLDPKDLQMEGLVLFFGMAQRMVLLLILLFGIQENQIK
jgi:hypothetical protein